MGTSTFESGLCIWNQTKETVGILKEFNGGGDCGYVNPPTPIGWLQLNSKGPLMITISGKRRCNKGGFATDRSHVGKEIC